MLSRSILYRSLIFNTPVDTSVKPASPVFDSGHSLATGMVCAYLLNEGSGTALADSTGNLADATLTNGAWTTSDPGACINFTSANSYFTLPNISALFGSNEASLLLVLKLNADTPPSAPKSGLCYFSADPHDNHYPYTDGLIYMNAFKAVRVDSVSDGTFDKAAWHRYGISAKNGASNYRQFQNGALLNAAAGEASVSISATSTVGKAYGLAHFDGLIASAMLWSRALSDAEMTTLESDPWVMFR